MNMFNIKFPRALYLVGCFIIHVSYTQKLNGSRAVTYANYTTILNVE